MADRSKVLVVDDDEAFRKAAETALKADYDVLTAPDGEQGLRMACEIKPDVIVCDVMMPKVAGIEMLRALQADIETRSIPCIVVSASHANPATKTLFEQESNFFAFLPKPCNMPDLKAKLQEALASKLS